MRLRETRNSGNAFVQSLFYIGCVFFKNGQFGEIGIVQEAYVHGETSTSHRP